HARLAEIGEDFHRTAAAVVLFAGLGKRAGKDVLGPQYGLDHLGPVVIDSLRLEPCRGEQLRHLIEGKLLQQAAGSATPRSRRTALGATATRARLSVSRRREGKSNCREKSNRRQAHGESPSWDGDAGYIQTDVTPRQVESAGLVASVTEP